MSINKNELANYKSLNSLARKNSVVILGANYMKEMPVGELKQVFGIISDIYNRSLSDLSVFEARPILEDIITQLCPKKIILQLGETDLEKGTDVDKVIAEVSSLLNTIKKMDRSLKIVLVSINNLTNKQIETEFNIRLSSICTGSKVQFADITSAASDDSCRIQTFRLLRYFMSDDMLLQIM